jgi:hypothetical protein
MSTGRDLKKLKDVMSLDMTGRGTYLAHVVPIEQIVKDIISQHFCMEEKRRLQLVLLVLNGRDFTFSSAIEILEKILKTSYPEVLKKYHTVHRELDKIRRFRNVMAHSELDISEEFLSKDLKDTIQLIYHDDEGNSRYREITRREFDDRLKDCRETTFHIIEIRKEVRNLRSRL